MKTNALGERIVRCPQCGGDSVFAPSNKWRPFCSERCRQIDLGAWASESFRMPATPPQDPDERGAEFGSDGSDELLRH